MISPGAPTVLFSLNAEGRIGEAFCADRPRAMPGGGFRRSPWRGRFFDYAVHDGVWVPSAARVSWISDGVATDVWEGRVLEWALAR